MEDAGRYLSDLRNSDPDIRDQATKKLWSIWYGEAGERAEFRLREGSRLMETSRLDEAEKTFLDIIAEFPAFSEGHNKLATVLFLKGRFSQSIAECVTTISLNPNHFGAWNGMGMCLYNIGKYDEAIRCFEKALAIQPYADANRMYVERCRRKLN